MTKPNLLNPEFWISLRKRTSLDGWVGVEECSYWTNEVLDLLREYRPHGFIRIEGGVSSEQRLRHHFFVDYHRALGKRLPDGIFIADDTAGQIHDDYLLGYYGYIDDAPARLRVFYKEMVKGF